MPERGNLIPPPMCRVEEKLIQLSKEQGELDLSTSIWQSVHSNTWHPPWESRRWSCSPCIWFHLNKSKVLWPNHGFREGIHDLYTKLYYTKFKIFKVARTKPPTHAYRLQGLCTNQPILENWVEHWVGWASSQKRVHRILTIWSKTHHKSPQGWI